MVVATVERETNSLGFRKARSETRVVVAMSGGVDSSVVAAMLARDGYDVIGITLQLYDHGHALARKGACCAGVDIRDARRVAAELQFPHYVLNYENIFRESVIDEFADSYLAGATPVPCIRCNERVKFSELLQTARGLDADCLATGHYVRRVAGELGCELHRAADFTRDQSYFLFSTRKDQLDYLRFPLGDLSSKAETRRLAGEFGLRVATKPDSQDICFVPNGHYSDVIQKLRPEAGLGGDIVDLDGKVLGQHRGILHYTVGQRRGLGIGGLSKPLYVVRLDAENRRVIVGPRSELEARRVIISDVNWLGDRPFEASEDRKLTVKLRSTRPPALARVFPLGARRAEVRLPAGEFGVSPGQACVFYASGGSRVYGGGWIESAE